MEKNYIPMERNLAPFPLPMQSIYYNIIWIQQYKMFHSDGDLSSSNDVYPICFSALQSDHLIIMTTCV